MSSSRDEVGAVLRGHGRVLGNRHGIDRVLALERHRASRTCVVSVDAGGIERALDVDGHAHRLCRNDSGIGIDDGHVRIGSHDKRLRLDLRGQRAQRYRRRGQEHVRAVGHAGKQQNHETNDEQRGYRDAALLAWLAALRGNRDGKNGRIERDGRSAGNDRGRQHLGVGRWLTGARMFARHRSVDPLVESPILLAKGRQSLFGCRYRVVGGQTGRDREGADLRLIADSDDVHPPLSGLARQQLEVDARCRDFRAGRDDEDRVRVRRRADPPYRGRYLVVGLDIDRWTRQTFIWRSTRRNAESSGDFGSGHLERLVGQRHRGDVLFVDQQTGCVGDLGDLLDLDRIDLRRPGKRKVLGQGWITQRGTDLRQAGASPAQVDPARAACPTWRTPRAPARRRPATPRHPRR